MPFCSNCGSKIDDNAKFCSNCANPLSSQPKNPMPQPSSESNAPTDEIAYFKGEGALVVKKTEHRGAGRKIGSLLFAPATLGISYLAFGRDKTTESKAQGTLVVTNKAIYCAGNSYPFDRILSITKTDYNSISLTFEKNVGAGGRADGGIMATGNMSVEVELETKDIDGLFKALEQAKMAHIKF